MKKWVKMVFLIVYFVVGLYFINLSFEYLPMPEYVLNLSSWINLVGGVLIIYGGINHLRLSMKKTRTKKIKEPKLE